MKPAFMKLALAALACLLGLLGATASHATQPSPVGSLNDEEIALVQAFRANPFPFRRLLQGTPLAPPPAPTFIGPRDVIDVTVSGGKIVFAGKRRDYVPASIRLVRGQETEMVFMRQGKPGETVVRVAYRPDGLHFDIPEAAPGTRATPRGFIVVPESPDWKAGQVFKWTGHIDTSRSASEAENITFQIRYSAR